MALDKTNDDGWWFILPCIPRFSESMADADVLSLQGGWTFSTVFARETTAAVLSSSASLMPLTLRQWRLPCCSKASWASSSRWTSPLNWAMVASRSCRAVLSEVTFSCRVEMRSTKCLLASVTIFPSLMAILGSSNDSKNASLNWGSRSWSSAASLTSIFGPWLGHRAPAWIPSHTSCHDRAMHWRNGVSSQEEWSQLRGLGTASAHSCINQSCHSPSLYCLIM